MIRELQKQTAELRLRAQKTSQEEIATITNVLAQEQKEIEMEKMKSVKAQEKRLKHAHELKRQLEETTSTERGVMSQQEISMNKARLLAFKEAKRQGKFQDFDKRVKTYGL